MTERRNCACGCGTSLDGLRADAVYASEACSKRARRAASPDKARTDHPLQAVRDERATKKHNRDLGGLIRQAIIDRLKTTGECHADDLIPLYPEGEVALCRRLATAQFGSLAGSELIREKERRKSKIPQRKGAKSGVYIFTAKGRAKLVGIDAVPSSGDGPSRALVRGVDSGDQPLAGTATGCRTQSLSSGDPGDNPSAGVPTPQGSGGSAFQPPSTSTGAPDQLAGVSAEEAREPGPVPDVAPDGRRTSRTCADPGESASGAKPPMAPDAPPEPLTLLSDEVGVEGPKSAFTDQEWAA
jgi:hypothetical protein